MDLIGCFFSDLIWWHCGAMVKGITCLTFMIYILKAIWMSSKLNKLSFPYLSVSIFNIWKFFLELTLPILSRCFYELRAKFSVICFFIKLLKLPLKSKTCDSNFFVIKFALSNCVTSIFKHITSHLQIRPQLAHLVSVIQALVVQLIYAHIHTDMLLLGKLNSLSLSTGCSSVYLLL